MGNPLEMGWNVLGIYDAKLSLDMFSVFQDFFFNSRNISEIFLKPLPL